VYRTTPTAILFREAGLPSGNVALENAKLRFAVHLQTVDHSHPLAQRMKIPTIRRGTGAGGPQQPRTKIQRHGGLLHPVPRPLLVPPHYTPGCRVNPTGGLDKKAAAERFKLWWQHLSSQDVTIFSDGSEQWVEGIKHVTYGYAIYQNQQLLKTDRGSLNARSHVFDTEQWEPGKVSAMLWYRAKSPLGSVLRPGHPTNFHTHLAHPSKSTPR
jgi:hypothetical protein